MIYSLRTRLTIAGIWLALLAFAFVWGETHHFAPVDMILLVYRYVEGHAWGPLIYIGLYALRPFILFPAMLLTITSGSLFGFLGGWALTIVGENLSANVAYLIARFLAGDAINESTNRFVRRWRPTLEEQAISTIIILRIIYLPFDLVNYACGILGVPWWKYALATFIGILPPMVTFVSFGASIDVEEVLRSKGTLSVATLINSQQLWISVGLLVASLVLARVVHLRHRHHVRRKRQQ